MKLFVSVGTQLPFERLLSMVESLNQEDKFEIVYQISESNFKSENATVYKYLSPNDYKRYFDWCDVFVSHAGMGSIITALEAGKPIVITPRLYSYNEHRNDHQLATVERFRNYPLVQVASNKDELLQAFEKLANFVGVKVNLDVDNSIINFLQEVIELA